MNLLFKFTSYAIAKYKLKSTARCKSMSKAPCELKPKHHSLSRRRAHLISASDSKTISYIIFRH